MTDEKSADVPQGMYLLGAWLDKAINVWLAHWNRWLAVGFLYTALTIGANLLLRHLVGVSIFTRSWHPGADPRFFVYVLSITGVLLVLRALFDPGIVTMALADLRRQPIDATGLLRAVPRWFLPALVLYLLNAVLSLIGIALCVVGVVYVATSLWLVVPVMVDQRAHPLTAIGRSWETVSRNFWLFLAFSAFFWFLNVATGAILQPFQPTQGAWALGANLLFGTLFIPLLPIAQTVAYEESLGEPEPEK